MERRNPRNNDNNNDEKEKSKFPRPKPRIKKEVPKPKAVQNIETKLTNDPLWLDSFILDGETGFTSERAAQPFNADAAGYVSLVEQEYKAIGDVDKHYAKSIPASAHAYYHCVLFWHRIAQFHQKRGVADRDDDNLVRFVNGYGSALIASGAGEYLSGLGDYEDDTGVKHIIRAQPPDANGGFGVMTEVTHKYYETLPAPAIFHRRVVEDLLESQRRDGNGEWDREFLAGILPAQDPGQRRNANERARRERDAEAARERHREERGPEDNDAEGGQDEEDEDEDDEAAAVLPTVNLLGWRKSKKMVAAQVREIEDVIELRS